MKTTCKIIAAVFALWSVSVTAYASDEWQNLFNGEDLSGWTVVKGGKYFDENSLDEESIYSVHDGSMRVYHGAPDGSVQYKALITHEKQLSGNFHLQVEYRWREGRYIPRSESKRDAGILFHVHSRNNQIWPSCLEMQLGDGQPGERNVAGDLWVSGKTLADVSSRDGFFNPDAPSEARGHGMRRFNLTRRRSEKPLGEWNTADIIVYGSARAEFYLNGKLVNEVRNMRKRVSSGAWAPLAGGRIALQAEWAEIEYRVVRVREL
ncbi:3-keto-disaccharide hydrolase [Pelagicoccus mobilis]|uniref:DUF1080 domain-containing protein n=1 Tax=Pelagicoccus mobilis TaxID=415221 RepID=A0A934RXA9_9BACT|nr:DUF1080 domain-containing protein [Pelagicoccus mobilis]MBK1875283.1 DUF1080 domain-containing protein [Pelagicoccus mobilis]